MSRALNVSRISTYLSSLADSPHMSRGDIERYEAKFFFLPTAGRALKKIPEVSPRDPAYLLGGDGDPDNVDDEDFLNTITFGNNNANYRERLSDYVEIHPEVARISQHERQILKFHSLREHNRRYHILESDFNRFNNLMTPLRTHLNNSCSFQPLAEKVIFTYQHRMKERKGIATFDDWAIEQRDVLSDKEIDELQRKIQSILHTAINMRRKLPVDSDRLLELALAGLVERRKLRAELGPILRKGPQYLRSAARDMEDKILNAESNLKLDIYSTRGFKTRASERLNEDIEGLTQIVKVIKTAREEYKEWERMQFRKMYKREIGQERAQSVIDTITNSYAAEGHALPFPGMPGMPGFPGGPPPPGGLPAGMPPPPFGFPGATGMPPPPGGFPGGLPPPGGRGMPLPLPLPGQPGAPPLPLPGMPGAPPFPPNFPLPTNLAGGMPPLGPNGMPLPIPPPGGLPAGMIPPPGFHGGPPGPPGGINPPPGLGMPLSGDPRQIPPPQQQQLSGFGNPPS
ncbi:hypothetical protein TWF506_007216 [Arthrobotrys conoides]|uniref:Uncharacterized protein n=1 Tax=Arthrobotrys conoides TaxID=74498 RepID=A0AAN8PGZ9_9PEZI